MVVNNKKVYIESVLDDGVEFSICGKSMKFYYNKGKIS